MLKGGGLSSMVRFVISHSPMNGGGEGKNWKTITSIEKKMNWMKGKARKRKRSEKIKTKNNKKNNQKTKINKWENSSSL